MNDDHKIIPAHVYWKVYGLLLILTVVTVAVAYVHLGIWNVIVPMSIAMAKAMLVVLFFMGLKYSPRLTQIWAVAGVFFLLIMFGLTMGDYVRRVIVGGW